jgi:hypothetical protein
MFSVMFLLNKRANYIYIYIHSITFLPNGSTDLLLLLQLEIVSNLLGTEIYFLLSTGRQHSTRNIKEILKIELYTEKENILDVKREDEGGQSHREFDGQVHKHYN